jgi:D-methionine transport system substrate-binding protein
MRILFYFFLALLVCSCDTRKDAMEIRVGTMAGSDAQLMQVVQNVALEKFGLHVKIIQFTDYSQPNEALMNGEIDINVFQHQPYLIAWNAKHHGDLMPVAKSFIFPMGIYSYKVDRVKELSKGNVILIPDDATNEARALLLMQKAGLITLMPGKDVLATPADIISNPEQLQIKPLDAAKLAGSLPDADAAVINSNYAIAGGLIPKRGDVSPSRKDAIYLEDTDALYANVFVVRPKEKNDLKVREFVEAFHSPQVWAAAQTLFQGSAIEGWKR